MVQRERSVMMRGALVSAVWIVVGYLALLAAWPRDVPTLGWFGRAQQPWTTLTVAIVVVLIAAVCLLGYREEVAQRPEAFPVFTVVLLVAISVLLALRHMRDVPMATIHRFSRP